MKMGYIEKWIKANPSGTYQEFPQKKVPSRAFNEIKYNNIIADVFQDSNRTETPTLDELIDAIAGLYAAFAFPPNDSFASFLNSAKT